MDEIIQEIRNAGFEYDIALNEYSETCHQIRDKHGKLVYSSYNEYCISAFIDGVNYDSDL